MCGICPSNDEKHPVDVDAIPIEEVQEVKQACATTRGGHEREEEREEEDFIALGIP